MSLCLRLYTFHNLLTTNTIFCLATGNKYLLEWPNVFQQTVSLSLQLDGSRRQLEEQRCWFPSFSCLQFYCLASSRLNKAAAALTFWIISIGLIQDSSNHIWKCHSCHKLTGHAQAWSLHHCIGLLPYSGEKVNGNPRSVGQTRQQPPTEI